MHSVENTIRVKCTLVMHVLPANGECRARGEFDAVRARDAFHRADTQYQ
jgi:hypothetical protein